MSLFIVNQEANANFLVRRARDFKRFSITSVRSPVSMALELATARTMLARETDTLPEFFLRTMGRLRNKMTGEIITLGGRTVLSVFTQAFQSPMNTIAGLSREPKPLSSKRAALSSKSDSLPSIQHLKSSSRMQRGLASKNCRLEPEIKLTLGEIVA